MCLCAASNAGLGGLGLRSSAMALRRCTARARPLTIRRLQSAQVQTQAFTHASSPSFQEAAQQLQAFWAQRGALLAPSHNVEVGAGTMNPATFLRVLGPEPWWACYLEAAVRPADSRFGDNPNRTQRHTQLQVVLQPEPDSPQELYLQSLEALGVNASLHDVRFVEDDWESPVLGAWGLGWEVWLDGLEITQFTYFQQAGGLQCSPPAVEITYGLERILMSLQRKQHFKDIVYSPNGELYGDLLGQVELEFSFFNLNFADISDQRRRFEMYEAEAWRLCNEQVPLPAYDHLLKASHAFNILDARGAVSVTERADLFQRMRNMARECARLWLERRRELGFPLGEWQHETLPQLPEPNITGSESESTLRDLALELRTEELPADDVTSGSNQLHDKIHSLLSTLWLHTHSLSISAGGTPRRLWCIAHNVPARQPDRRERVRGPPVSKAYDEDGLPTKALEGFCRKNGADPQFDIEIEADSKGTEHCYATVLYEGQPTLKALSESLGPALEQLAFKKTMRWRGDSSFSRPVRSVLALYGDDVLPLCAFGVLSGRTTQLLRSTAQPTANIEKAESYADVVESDGIVLEGVQRVQTICETAKAVASREGGEIPEWALGDLAEEVCNLVEAPQTLLGHFSEDFLQLPREVLEVVMRNHQRYFPVVGPSGSLLPCFVFTVNGKPSTDVTTDGHEAVLRSRFEDATFFYKQDTEANTLVENFRPMLDGIYFEKSLGTMLAKVKRCEALLPHLASLLSGVGDDVLKVAKEGAHLHRADRATNLVQEFTELEGVMGRHYALKEGTSEAVADVVLEGQKPRFAGDEPADSIAGALVAISDRIDSLTGLYAAVGGPTASGDQFGMRRLASGLVETVLKHRFDFDLRSAVSIAATQQPVVVNESAQSEVVAFVIRRLEQKLADEGVSIECTRAVANARAHNLLLTYQSAIELDDMYRRDTIRMALTAFSRPSRLVRSKASEADGEIDERLLSEEAEKQLLKACEQMEEQLGSNGVAIPQFVDATEKHLAKPVERFFDDVFVMAEDDALRKNRLALLNRVASLCKGVVDFTQLPGY